EQGLNRAAKRQTLLMDNLANANVPGYKRRDIDFNVALSDEMAKGGSIFGSSRSEDEFTNEGSVIRYFRCINPSCSLIGCC
ncbi:MAG: hypothetical protein EOP45_16055, partial [Sphingobacteriaceae bacterium]